MASTQLLQEISDGSGEPLSRAARRFPAYRLGRPVTLSCLVRWITAGVRGPDGERIRLEAARLAGRWLTTPQAVQRFIAAQTPDLDTAPVPAPRSRSSRRRASERADAALRKLGFS
jgi:hypothetical protein